MAITLTTLSNAITSYSTQFVLASTTNVNSPLYASALKEPSYLFCEKELMFVTGVPFTGTVTVRRGQVGTTAASHAANTVVAVGLASDLPLITSVTEVANVTLLAQTASVPTTVLYAVPYNGGGMYAVYLDVICTVAGSAGSVTVGVNWNNGTTAAGLVTQAFSLAATGEQTVLYDNFVSAASQNITYVTTVSGATGNPQYSVGIRLQYLG